MPTQVERRVELAQHLVEKYGPKVSNLFGLQYQAPTSIGVGQMTSRGAAAQSQYGGGITFDSQFLKTASRQDFRGALIHELTHVEGAGYGKDKRAEVLADYARYTLNPKEDPNWSPSTAVLAVAKKRGDVSGPNNGDGNRLRNTLANTLSKNKVDYKNPGGAAALPAMSPASTANYYSQLSGLAQQYTLQAAALRAQRVGIQANLKTQKADIKGQLISGLAGEQNASIETNMLGSSANLQRESDVRGTAAGELAKAKADALAGKAQVALGKQQAGLDYFNGATSLEANKLAEQQTALAQQLQNNLIVSGQESQMNVLQAMYDAQMAALQGGGGKKLTAPDYSGLSPNALIPGVNMSASSLQSYLSGGTSSYQPQGGQR